MPLASLILKVKATGMSEAQAKMGQTQNKWDSFSRTVEQRGRKINEWLKAHQLAAVAIIGAFAGVMYKIQKYSPSLQYFTAMLEVSFMRLAMALEPGLRGAVDKVIPFIEELTAFIEKQDEDVNTLLVSLGLWGTAALGIAKFINPVVGAMVGLAGALHETITYLDQSDKPLDNFVGWLLKIQTKPFEAVAQAIKTLPGLVDEVVGGIVIPAYDVVFNAVKGAGEWLWDMLPGPLKTYARVVLEMVAGAWNFAWEIIDKAKRGTGYVVKGIIDLAGGAWNQFWDILDTAYRGGAKVIKAILDIGAGAWNNFWEILMNAINAVAYPLSIILGLEEGEGGPLWDLIHTLWGTASYVLNVVFDLGMGIGGWLFDLAEMFLGHEAGKIKYMVEMVLDYWNWVAEAVNWAVEGVAKPIRFVVEFKAAGIRWLTDLLAGRSDPTRHFDVFAENWGMTNRTVQGGVMPGPYVTGTVPMGYGDQAGMPFVVQSGWRYIHRGEKIKPAALSRREPGQQSFVTEFNQSNAFQISASPDTDVSRLKRELEISVKKQLADFERSMQAQAYNEYSRRRT